MEKSITYESSAPDTPAQNSHSERKREILAMKARAMHIEAGLPTYLWNKIVQIAGYIMNRTPMQKHNWKTPFEVAVGQSPNLGHLRKIGCKAYTLDKHIPQKEKLRERAHIGHLIEYDSTNIFQVWIPSQQKIIRTRDVLFDKTSFYNSHKLDLMQLATEPMVEAAVFDIPNLDLTAQITEIESDKEDLLDEVNTEAEFIKTGDKTQTPITHLSTPDLTEISLPETPETSGLSDSELSELGFSAPEIPNSQPQTASRANKISATLDTANVLPEEVGRTRTRQNAYVTALENSAQGNLIVFHKAFSAFVAANSYYYAPKLPNVSEKSVKLVTLRFHRDSLPLEPLNYQQMLKHSHADRFIHASYIAIQALQAKGT